MALCPVCWWEDDGQEDGDAGDVRLTVIRSFVICAIWIPYFLQSRRVALTFVN